MCRLDMVTRVPVPLLGERPAEDVAEYHKQYLPPFRTSLGFMVDVLVYASYDRTGPSPSLIMRAVECLAALPGDGLVRE
jgi:hypothetical protein